MIGLLIVFGWIAGNLAVGYLIWTRNGRPATGLARASACPVPTKEKP